MPKPSLYRLIWSDERTRYELYRQDRHSQGQPEQCFRPEDEPTFSRWLTEHNSFAFVGQAGRLSVIKEARRRGTGYWYAYRRQERHTRKCYLGRTAGVTFARLEQVAKLLTSSSSSAAPGLEPTAVWSEHSEALPSNKLAPPRLPRSIVERPRLLSELDAVCAHPLTLVSAFAGAGKTTLLSAWAASFRQDTRSQATGTAGHEPTLAWLSLEALDNDPIRFWAAVIAALRTCLPTVGTTALALLHAQEAPPLSTILTHLLNEIEQVGGELILVLDDYHVIEDPAIHETMLFLIEHLPLSLHVVLATRTDPEFPLSRWRVRGEVLEIRSSDLQFTQVETANFLLQCMELPLSEDDVVILQHRTEGWIAGLQLAALSMRKQQDLPGFVKDFAGSYRYLLDYIQQDILARLPETLQHFLLQTSLVARMNAALCQAITAGPSQQASQEMLEELERANLFLVPLDEQRQWYRYHDLFREAVRARLQAAQPELVPLLHVRAARWHEAQGEWREAIAHALMAPDYALAASLMEQAASRFWQRGEARTVQNWVLSLPDVVLRAHMRLAFNAALRLLNTIHISTETVHASMVAQVERTAARMEAILHNQQSFLLSEAEVALIERRLRLLRALIEVRAYFKRGDKERLRRLAQEVEALPQDEEMSWRMIPLTFAFWLTLAFQQENALLVPRLRSAKQWISEAGDHLAMFRVMTWLARTYIQAGQMRLAYQECQDALAVLERIGGSIAVAGYLFSSLFDICYAWNRLEEAADALGRLLRIARDWQQVELLAIGERAVVQLALARGDLGTAQEALQRAEVLLEREEFANNARWVVDTRVQVWLAQGDLTAASDWAAQTTIFRDAWDPLRKWEVLLLARVTLAEHQYAQAVETLERFGEHFDQPEDSEKMLEWMALYVVALRHAGKSEQAAPVAARLLALTEPEGYIRLYLDAGEPMRGALAALRNAEAAERVVPDTLLAEGRNAPPASISRSYLSRLLVAFEQEERRHPHRTGATGASRASQHEIQHEIQRVSPASLASPAAEMQRQGTEPLSRQELKVLRLLVAGQTYAEMAEALIVSPNTIKTQVSSIYRKLSVSRRAEAIATAQRLRLV